MKIEFRDVGANAPDWLACNVELVFTEPDEALCGLKITGLSVRKGDKGLWVAFPSQKGKDGKWHSYVRTALREAKPEFRLKDAVLKAYEAHLHSEDESAIPSQASEDEEVPF